MANITLTFNGRVNSSLQAAPQNVELDSPHYDVGAWDKIYFVRIVNNVQDGGIIELGDCVNIEYDIDTDTTVVTVFAQSFPSIPIAEVDFIFFGKNTSVGTSGLVGYFAEVEMKNNSTEYAELFSVSSEAFPSSK
mgnify:CR=1 FL=1|tara:strand:- start:247 stop:651 length:405 start_codon:yes stop_codon:yes gene_type:complete